MLQFICYIPFFLFVVYQFLVLTWKLWTRKYSFLTCVSNVPWLGSVPYLSIQIQDSFKQRVGFNIKYNHLYVYWLFHVPVIRTGRVEYVEPMLKVQGGSMRKSLVQIYLAEWLGDGLITSTGTKWKQRRQALTYAFHFNILNDFVEIFEKHAYKLVQKLGTVYNKESVEVQHLMSLTMLGTICETSMGVHLDDCADKDDYISAVEDIKVLIRLRLLSFLPDSLYKYSANGKKFYRCVKTLRNFTIKVINDNIAVRNELGKGKPSDIETEDGHQSYQTKKKRAFVDILLDMYDKGEIDVEGIQEEVDTFMAGGHDTTSTAMSWLLYEVARHPDVQRKVQEEIDTVSLEDSDLVNKIRMLKYTECVIKEMLRLHPVIPGFARKLEKDVPVGQNIIPSGTVMQVDIHSLHTNTDYWENPFAFNPDRFNEGVKRPNPYCYIPFSAGPRNCIGQKFGILELKVFIFVLLSKFNIESQNDAMPAVDLGKFSTNGIFIKFSPRE